MFKTDSFIGNKKFEFNPIPIGCCHVTLIYGMIPPMAGRNRVKPPLSSLLGTPDQKTNPKFDFVHERIL